MGGLCGIFGLITTSAAASEPQQQIASLTILKEWSPESEVNGPFEADRRAWLASMRKDRVVIDPDEIVEEELAPAIPEKEEEQEFSRDILEDYIDIIGDEISPPE